VISINEVTLYGRLGDDAEVKKTKSDTEFMRFRIATNRPFQQKDKTWTEETQWHQCVCWDSALVRTFKGKALKGAEVYLKGELIHRTYGEKDDLKYITEVVVPQFRGKLVIIAKSNGSSGDSKQPQVANETADEIPI
jgi:single-strand DNA-binding protein